MLYDWQTLSGTGPRRLNADIELAIYLLTPGFSRAYHQEALKTSNATLWKYMRWAVDLAQHNPGIGGQVMANLASITAQDGLLMAQRRGRAQLPYWSRLAICEYLEIHRSATAVAKMFGCSARTIYNVQRGACLAYHRLTGDRQLSASQTAPPAARQRLPGATMSRQGMP
jgi:hypothetical protein